MFDWFWNFLYGITKSLLRLVDTIMHAANVLIGITPVTIDGKNEYLLDYFVLSQPVDFAVKVCAVLGFMFTIMLTIVAILKSMARDYKDGTPAQIGMKAFKAILTFIAVPFCMITLFLLGNAFMVAIYKATAQGSTSLGSFLFVNLAEEAGKSSFAEARSEFLKFNEYTGSGGLSYLNTSTVSSYVNLSDFNFILSWIIGAVLLYVLGSTFLVFVERIFSLIILYILAPFSVGSSVLDDGARFKLWRDQVLIKFFSGYGTILAINIYCMVMSLIASDRVKFFADSSGSSNSFLDFITKIIIIVGGGLTLKKSMALVGNLISSGGGSGEISGATSAGGIAGTMLGLAATATGLNLAKGIISAGWQGMKRKVGERAFGVDGGGSGSKKGGAGGGDNNDNNGNGGGGGDDNQNNENPNYNQNNDVREQLEGQDNNNNNGGGGGGNDNQNNQNPQNQNNNNVMQAIEGNNNELGGNNVNNNNNDGGENHA